MRVLSIAVVCALVACHAPSGAGPSGPLSSTWAGPPLLAYVPADTPYLIAVLEPRPELQRRMVERFAAKMRTIAPKIDALRAVDRSTLAPWLRAVLAATDGLSSSDPSTWGQALGLDPSGRMVFYGLGLWPVLRYALSDPGKLRAAIDRAAAAAGDLVRKHSDSGHAYWTLAVRDRTVVCAIVEHHAVVALVPTASVGAALPYLLGSKLPGDSLRTAQVLPQLLARHGFGPAMVGYLDAQRLVDVIEQGGPLHDAPTAQLAARLPGPCRSDLARIVAVAPRLAFGYTKLDEHGMAARLVLETPSWLAAQLSHLRAEVPAPPTSGVPVLAMGVAVDVDALHAWLGDVVGQLHAHPLTCPAFAEFNDGMGELGTSLANPLPPMLHGLRGMSLVVDDAGLSPPHGTGHVVLFGDHVADLVALAGKFVPWVAALHVTNDGTPIAVPLAQLGVPGLSSAHLAMRGDRLVLAVGDRSEQRAREQLAAPAHGRSPLFTFAYDPKRLVDAFGSLIHDPSSIGLYFASVAMVLDAADDGLSLDIRGTWAPVAAPAAH